MKKGLSLDFDCQVCGQHHRLPLDETGHYSGPLPCDPTKHVELQVDHQDLRAVLAAEAETVRH